jgi:hypothetical protein
MKILQLHSINWYYLPCLFEQCDGALQRPSSFCYTIGVNSGYRLNPDYLLSEYLPIVALLPVM